MANPNRSLFLIFNHRFSYHQEADARASLRVNNIISLPESLQLVWGNVPPDLPEVEQYLAPVKCWLSEKAQPGDAALIQGDFGATYLMVRFCMERGFTPYYATTLREAVEEQEADGSTRMTHRFRHVRFRKYGL
jgi:hypothetical protein